MRRSDTGSLKSGSRLKAMEARDAGSRIGGNGALEVVDGLR